MMNSPAGRLTAREIIAKTFSAKARRGYDPAEVDAYLMDIARQVDELNLEIDRLTNEVVRLSFSQPSSTSAATPTSAPMPAAELPPPPPAPPAPEPVVEPEPAPVIAMVPPAPPAPPAPAPAPAATPAPAAAVASAPAPAASSHDLSAEEESLKLILKAAQKTAEQTIVDARSRAEEIIAEARYRASEITRESDRKAFEAASRIQTEIVNLEDQLTQRRGELESIHRQVESEKTRVRTLAQELLRTVGDGSASKQQHNNVIQLEPAPVVDLTTDTRAAAAHEG